jgi:DNA modification methylase
MGEDLERFLNKVFHGDALRLLRALPTRSIDAVILDAMYGTAKHFEYEWGEDPGRGDPIKHWQYHEPIYRECLRVLKPGGVLAWGQGAKFARHFPRWFGGHRVWTLTRFGDAALIAIGNVWVVQTRERQPVELPHRDSLVMCDRPAYLSFRKLHPCPKPVEELAFLVESLTKPGEIILDCFCGVGSTLIAAEMLNRRWIGCDLGRTYCQVAMQRLEGVKKKEPRHIGTAIDEGGEEEQD